MYDPMQIQTENPFDFSGESMAALVQLITGDYTGQISEASLLAEPEACFIGERARKAIAAAMELGRRMYAKTKDTANSPELIWRMVRKFADVQENFVALYFNTALEVLEVKLITRGTINRSIITPREILTHAVRLQAHSIAIAHNHPTGNLEPSREDIEATRRIAEAGKILDIQLIDHLIFSEDSWYSMVEHQNWQLFT